MGILIPRQTLNANRYTGGARVKGKWVDGTLNPFTIKASVQPLEGKDMETLPETRRASGESYRLITDDILYTTQNSEKADRVTFDGDDFEVFSEAEKWTNNIINHRVYIIIRLTTK